MSNVRYGIGLLGFGTVGSGLYDLLLESKGQEIQSKHRVSFDVRKILVRDLKAKRRRDLPEALVARSFEEIVSDGSVDIVVEVMGGEIPAKDYILASLKAGKHVVTANKKLMASEGEKLVRCARQYERYFGFAGAVTGCYEFCSSIADAIMIRGLSGVFNSTSNLILTKMEEGLSFEEALKEAQANGYAEADASEDIDGHDTRNKLIILARLAFGASLNRDQIPISGIRNITQLDMRLARELGYTIRLLGVCRPTADGRIDARVHPSFVPLSHPLASVKGIYNGLQVYDALRGARTYNAIGAGSTATAMAVMKDLVEISRRGEIIWPNTSLTTLGVKHVKPYSTVRRYYVRIAAENRPGVLAKISRIFGRHDINISSVIQHGPTTAGPVPVVVMCGPTEERVLRKSLAEIEALRNVSTASQFIRVEDALEDNETEDGIASGRTEAVPA